MSGSIGLVVGIVVRIPPASSDLASCECFHFAPSETRRARSVQHGCQVPVHAGWLRAPPWIQFEHVGSSHTCQRVDADVANSISRVGQAVLPSSMPLGFRRLMLTAIARARIAACVVWDSLRSVQYRRCRRRRTLVRWSRIRAGTLVSLVRDLVNYCSLALREACLYVLPC